MQNNKKNARRGLAWLAVGFVVFVIFCLSAQPHSAEFTSRIFGEYNCIARPLAHVVEFATLFLVLRWALGKTIAGAGLITVYLCALFLCAGYAVVDEWHQSFVPGRTSSLEHVRNDLIGAGIAASVCASIEVSRWLLGRKQSHKD